MQKTTLATIKSFIKNNRSNLHIMVESTFDGMTDCVQDTRNHNFTPALTPDINHKNYLGVQGAWFVFGSRDYFSQYNKNGFVGYRVYNCCGAFVLAIPAQQVAA